MPYVDNNLSICRVGHYNELRTGDIIVTLPSVIKSEGRNITVPPLTVIGKNCDERIDTLAWVDGIEVSERLKVNLRHSENQRKIKLNVEVKSPNVHSAYTLKSLMDGKEVTINEDKHDDLIEILLSEGHLIAGINRLTKSVEIFADDILIRAFGYSLFYYIPLP
ncbi:hypothetical protein [Sulfuracidifex tepidarius]|uniref:Uncharacterized protein n=1 Tax=Sulfuracidifex tepidarius TaxID=1294262 RepID=A0A510DUN4_9CREN|nr:hypothetical protein [Sulfuracidifex tepidarius]BBG23874.1 hypothetical protein IC006_1170 [Sulfuracidifex tepidarius]BBG26629.1 hypothetical protein IC007_1145 [Sulfuracidifex tepidarius]